MVHLALSSFSTILQLSVGTNLTFSTVLSLFDNPLSQEKRAIERLEQSGMHLSGAELSQEEKDAIRGVQSLKNKLTKFSASLERWTYSIFRPLAAASAFLAGGLLVDATYRGSDVALPLFHFLSFLSLVSIVTFSIYALIATSIRVSNFQKLRSQLDEVISSALVKQRHKISAAE